MPIDQASARTQLAALAPSIERFIEARRAAFPNRTRGLQVLLKDIEYFYAIYRPILVQLRSEKPDLFASLPERAPSTDFDPERRRVMIEDVQALLRDVRHCLDLLPPPGVQVALTVTKEGVFFAGQRTDAMKLVLDIVGFARTKLEVIDGYLDLGTLSLLTKEPKLQVEVITKAVDAATAQAIATLAKGKKLQVRTSDAFHDPGTLT